MLTTNKFWNENELEFVNCDYCGSDNTVPICTRPDGLKVVECTRCGLAYLNPRPNQSVVSRLYSKNYFKKEEGAGPARIGYADYFEISNRRTSFPELDFLELFQPLVGKSVLEVGCATGAVLVEAKRRGAIVTGLELSEYAAEEARKKKIPVIVGNFTSKIDILGTYDIAMAFEVVEHVQKPIEFIKQMTELIKPSGYLIISTANYRCSFRYGMKWVGFQTSFEHLYFFSDEVLFRITKSINLNLLSWYTIGTGSPAPYGDKTKTEIVIQKIKNRLRRIPGVVPLWQMYKDTLRPKSSQKPYELFGQGHIFVALFRKNR